MPSAVVSILLLLAGLAACSATPPNTEPVVAPAEETATSDVSALPPRAAGKISAEMVGKVSPVPAFMGHGEHFNIEIHADAETEGDMRHLVHLTWGAGSHKAKGILFYRGPRPAPAGRPIVLDGTLETTPKTTPISVEITRKACNDDADRPFPHTVVVVLGGSTRFNGCGELAMY